MEVGIGIRIGIPLFLERLINLLTGVYSSDDERFDEVAWDGISLSLKRGETSIRKEGLHELSRLRKQCKFVEDELTDTEIPPFLLVLKPKEGNDGADGKDERR